MTAWLLLVVACQKTGGSGTGDTSTPTDGTPNTQTGDTQTGDTQTSGGESYHPKNWADPANHGLTTKLQNGVDDQGGDCRDCHGKKLQGDGDAVACSSCHGADWETDCTFCHGDPSDGTGAPPRDIDNETQTSKLSFPQHRIHVDEGQIHGDYDCAVCHDKPEDALTSGHLFDDKTHGRAEVHFASVIDGSYDDGSQTCTVYCHGDGTGRTGSRSVSDGAVDCSSCHRSSPTTGQHSRHQSFTDCSDCHAGVNNNGNGFDDPSKHVDGKVDLDFTYPGNSMSFSNGKCTGSCHGEYHGGRTW